ncbi:SAM-dependent methyltransferase [Chloroflexi bacterium TSY]|nr:SAM-dependent methyltransferase [Chloroflexi bacterium TSY]
MEFQYTEVVPWGRNFDEYCRMFDLSPTDLSGKILGCGDGPASFNSICNAQGGRVTSVDPLYNLSKGEIAKRIDATFDTVISQTKLNQEKFRWDRIKSVDELGSIRMSAMQEFLESYELGKEKGAYLPGALPKLNFANDSFDIALSSHFLFLYTDNLGYQFHLDSILEMMRVAQEARIFPLLDFNARRSHFVDKIVDDLASFTVEIREVDYEFQIGGNELRLNQKNK